MMMTRERRVRVEALGLSVDDVVRNDHRAVVALCVRPVSTNVHRDRRRNVDVSVIRCSSLNLCIGLVLVGGETYM